MDGKLFSSLFLPNKLAKQKKIQYQETSEIKLSLFKTINVASVYRLGQLNSQFPITKTNQTESFRDKYMPLHYTNKIFQKFLVVCCFHSLLFAEITNQIERPQMPQNMHICACGVVCVCVFGALTITAMPNKTKNGKSPGN